MTDTPTRRRVLALSLALPAAALAGTRALAGPGVYTDWGVAIRGADPVAYFTEGAPVEGSARHILEWRGSTWHFASPANRDRFAADPLAYAPQFDGWCAWAVSRGKLASTDPTAWSIHEGQLYLNYSHAVQRRWLRDVPGNAARAHDRWPALAA
ncbi:MAG: YHS domain-containing (seleno)protein [Pseudomonadota bacterium]